MHEADFREAARRIVEKDSRYDLESYVFIREALDDAAKALKKPEEGPGRHITGQELLECIRDFALREFGPMAATVFKEWGVKKTEDFGEIVFNLVEAGILGKTESDKREDFAGGYDFREAFVKPFLPPSALAGKRHGRGRAKN
ncbi:MAG: hypothetical protein FJ224_05725 [Lentisphaerae bacterium]|nr:hypothetical protein [Lentisphaerota bacterium]